jgi:eukaryotic-like serine/threonine-protein kinase
MTDRRIDQVIAAFESAWKSGKRPMTEAALKHLQPEQHEAAVIRLLPIEISKRLAAGESLTLASFERRFPSQLALIKSSLEVQDCEVPPDSPQMENEERNVLTGIIALQNQFIDQETFVETIQACKAYNNVDFANSLHAQGAITQGQVGLLRALVDKHAANHNGDVQESIASLSSLGPIRHAIASIGDPLVRQDVETIVGPSAPPAMPDESPTIPPSNELPTIPPLDEMATVPPSATTKAKGHFGLGGSDASGARSASRFRIVRPHARGGLGQVSVAIDSELNRDVALKEIQPQYADDHDSRYRFRLEAEVTGRLEHPGIVPVYGLGQYDDGRPFYAMRFIQGDSLKEAIDAFHGANEKGGLGMEEHSLQLRRLIGRLIDVCNAIDYAHSRNVLHRDLKPGNIMLGKYGETLVVDWGLAKVLGTEQACESSIGPVIPTVSSADATPTMHGSAVGTPAYMSPEQAAGRISDLGPATDIYSLGATLYYLLTGRPPFLGNDVVLMLAQNQLGEFPRPTSINPNVPYPLESICLKAMALEPSDRYSTAKLMVDDLERWLADRPVSVHKDKWIDRAARWCRSKAEVLAITVAFLMLASSIWTSSQVGGLLGNAASAPNANATLPAASPSAALDVIGLSESLAKAYEERAKLARASGQVNGTPDQDYANAATIRKMALSPIPMSETAEATTGGAGQ